MKIILIFLLSTAISLASSDVEEILNDPIKFYNYGYCFIIKGKKENKLFVYQFDSFAGIMYFMSEFKINNIYVKDCDNQIEWRKITRLNKGD